MLSFTHRTLKGMAILAGGSGAAKLVGLASLPLITRLYAPADMGVLSVFSSLIMLLVPTLTLQYHRALPVPVGATESVNLLILSIALILTQASLLWLGLWAVGPIVFRQLSMEILIPFWWLLPLGAALLSSALSLQLWAIRWRKYRVIAGAELGQSLAGNGAKIGLAFVLAPPFGLLVGHILAQSGAALWYLRQFWDELWAARARVTTKRICTVARRYRDFPLYRAPSQLILLSSAQSPALFIAWVYGVEPAGQFGLAMLALSMPMNLIARNMGKAFFGEAAHVGRRDVNVLRTEVLRLTTILGAVGGCVAVALILVAPRLFPVVFGAEWAEAGRFASVLSIHIVFQFAAAPVMNVLSVLNREAVYLQLNLIRACLVALIYFASAFAAVSVTKFLLMYSVAMAFHYSLCFIKVQHELVRD